MRWGSPDRGGSTLAAVFRCISGGLLPVPDGTASIEELDAQGKSGIADADYDIDLRMTPIDSKRPGKRGV